MALSAPRVFESSVCSFSVTLSFLMKTAIGSSSAIPMRSMSLYGEPQGRCCHRSWYESYGYRLCSSFSSFRMFCCFR